MICQYCSCSTHEWDKCPLRESHIRRGLIKSTTNYGNPIWKRNGLVKNLNNLEEKIAADIFSKIFASSPPLPEPPTLPSIPVYFSRERMEARSRAIKAGRRRGYEDAGTLEKPDQTYLGSSDLWFAHGYREGFALYEKEEKEWMK